MGNWIIVVAVAFGMFLATVVGGAIRKILIDEIVTRVGNVPNLALRIALRALPVEQRPTRAVEWNDHFEIIRENTEDKLIARIWQSSQLSISLILHSPTVGWHLGRFSRARQRIARLGNLLVTDRRTAFSFGGRILRCVVADVFIIYVLVLVFSVAYFIQLLCMRRSNPDRIHLRGFVSWMLKKGAVPTMGPGGSYFQVVGHTREANREFWSRYDARPDPAS